MTYKSSFSNTMRNTFVGAALGLTLYSSYGFAQKLPLAEVTLQEGEVLINGRDYAKINEKIAFKGKLTDYPQSLITSITDVEININKGRSILEDTLKKGEITPQEAKETLDLFESAFRSYSKVSGMYIYTIFSYPRGNMAYNNGEEPNRFQREWDYVTTNISRVVDIKTGDVIAFPEKRIREFGVFANKTGLISHRINAENFTNSFKPREDLESTIEFLEHVKHKDIKVKYSFNRYLPDLLSNNGEVVDEYINPNSNQSFIEGLIVSLPIFGLLGFGLYRLLREDKKNDEEEKEKPKDEPEEINVEQLVDVWGINSETGKSNVVSNAEALNIWKIGKKEV